MQYSITSGLKGSSLNSEVTICQCVIAVLAVRCQIVCSIIRARGGERERGERTSRKSGVTLLHISPKLLIKTVILISGYEEIQTRQSLLTNILAGTYMHTDSDALHMLRPFSDTQSLSTNWEREEFKEGTEGKLDRDTKNKLHKNAAQRKNLQASLSVRLMADIIACARAIPQCSTAALIIHNTFPSTKTNRHSYKVKSHWMIYIHANRLEWLHDKRWLHSMNEKHSGM